VVARDADTVCLAEETLMATPPEYAAIRDSFAAPALAGRLDSFTADRDFDWASVFTAACTMSDGQRLLVRAASDLWTTGRSAGSAS
jgi:hypothetical protein